jgi:recombinational DNA repair protein RecR
MACQTFWQIVWTNKERGLSLAEAIQAALRHFDECRECQADTNPVLTDCPTCRAIAQAGEGIG